MLLWETLVFLILLTRCSSQPPSCPPDRIILNVECGWGPASARCPAGSTCIQDPESDRGYCCKDKKAPSLPVETGYHSKSISKKKRICASPLMHSGYLLTCSPGQASRTCPTCFSCVPLLGTFLGLCCEDRSSSACGSSLGMPSGYSTDTTKPMSKEEQFPKEYILPKEYVPPKDYVKPKHHGLPKEYVQPKDYVKPKHNIPPKEYVTPKGYVKPKHHVPPKEYVTHKDYVKPKHHVPPKEYVPPKDYVKPKHHVPLKYVPPKDYVKHHAPPKEYVPSKDYVKPKHHVPPKEYVPPADYVKPKHHASPKEYVPSKNYVKHKHHVPPKEYEPSIDYVRPKHHELPKEYIPPKDYDAHKHDVPPNKYVPPKDYVKHEHHAPPKEYVPPKDYVRPKYHVPPKEYVPPKDYVKNVPTKDYVRPNHHVPPKEYVPPKDYVQHEHYAPPKEYVPAKDYIKPEHHLPEEYVPPKKGVKPEHHILHNKYEPPKEYVQPEQYETPKDYVLRKKHVPHKEHISPKDYAEPKEHVPTKEHMPPMGYVIPEKHVPHEEYVPPKDYIKAKQHVQTKEYIPPTEYIPPISEIPDLIVDSMVGEYHDLTHMKSDKKTMQSPKDLNKEFGGKFFHEFEPAKPPKEMSPIKSKRPPPDNGYPIPKTPDITKDRYFKNRSHGKPISNKVTPHKEEYNYEEKPLLSDYVEQNPNIVSSKHIYEDKQTVIKPETGYIRDTKKGMAKKEKRVPLPKKPVIESHGGYAEKSIKSFKELKTTESMKPVKPKEVKSKQYITPKMVKVKHVPNEYKLTQPVTKPPYFTSIPKLKDSKEYEDKFVQTKQPFPEKPKHKPTPDVTKPKQYPIHEAHQIAKKPETVIEKKDTFKTGIVKKIIDLPKKSNIESQRIIHIEMLTDKGKSGPGYNDVVNLAKPIKPKTPIPTKPTIPPPLPKEIIVKPPTANVNIPKPHSVIPLPNSNSITTPDIAPTATMQQFGEPNARPDVPNAATRNINMLNRLGIIDISPGNFQAPSTPPEPRVDVRRNQFTGTMGVSAVTGGDPCGGSEPVALCLGPENTQCGVGYQCVRVNPSLGVCCQNTQTVPTNTRPVLGSGNAQNICGNTSPVAVCNMNLRCAPGSRCVQIDATNGVCCPEEQQSNGLNNNQPATVPGPSPNADYPCGFNVQPESLCLGPFNIQCQPGRRCVQVDDRFGVCCPPSPSTGIGMRNNVVQQQPIPTPARFNPPVPGQSWTPPRMGQFARPGIPGFPGPGPMG